MEVCSPADTPDVCRRYIGMGATHGRILGIKIGSLQDQTPLLLDKGLGARTSPGNRRAPTRPPTPFGGRGVGYRRHQPESRGARDRKWEAFATGAKTSRTSSDFPPITPDRWLENFARLASLTTAATPSSSAHAVSTASAQSAASANASRTRLIARPWSCTRQRRTACDREMSGAPATRRDRRGRGSRHPEHGERQPLDAPPATISP